jgi:hypothetical protein
MEQSTLQEILGVEREIRERLDAEREKASQWLEAERRTIEAAHRAEIEQIRAAAAIDEQAAERAALDKTALILEPAQAAVRSVDRLADEDLRRLVASRLPGILPRRSHAR